MSINLMWFRNDLRIYDNPALHRACAQGPCVAVYFLCQEQWRQHDVSFWQQDLILRQLRTLEADLARLNIPLRVLDCGDFSQLPDAMLRFALDHSISHVYCNAEYALNEARCVRLLVQRLSDWGVALHESHDQCVIAPGRVLTQSGEMFKVFTAFKRAYFKDFAASGRALMDCPAAQSGVSLVSDLRVLDQVHVNNPALKPELWPAGEESAHERLNGFIEGPILRYAEQRDVPSRAATSTLSPYLAIGALSTTQCLHAALSMNHGQLEGGHQGVDVWISELVWRDFYRHLLAAVPRLSRHEPFKAETTGLRWSHDAAAFQAWSEGRTGFPLVDAAMRQLNSIGWMHNRLRMVSAMFLTKHLFIDWRWGERYFMQRLVDGDLASNNGGWQWSASTGVDAAPYFRIFNPTRQSERFDPDGEFIRRHVPELATLDRRSIHAPSAEQARQLGYPLPMVDHAAAVAETKRQFQALQPAPTVVGGYLA